MEFQHYLPDNQCKRSDFNGLPLLFLLLLLLFLSFSLSSSFSPPTGNILPQTPPVCPVFGLSIPVWGTIRQRIALNSACRFCFWFSSPRFWASTDADQPKTPPDGSRYGGCTFCFGVGWEMPDRVGHDVQADLGWEVAKEAGGKLSTSQSAEKQVFC